MEFEERERFILPSETSHPHLKTAARLLLGELEAAVIGEPPQDLPGMGTCPCGGHKLPAEGSGRAESPPQGTLTSLAEPMLKRRSII